MVSLVDIPDFWPEKPEPSGSREPIDESGECLPDAPEEYKYGFLCGALSEFAKDLGILMDMERPWRTVRELWEKARVL